MLCSSVFVNDHATTSQDESKLVRSADHHQDLLMVFVMFYYEYNEYNELQ